MSARNPEQNRPFETEGGEALRPAFDNDLRITAVDQFAGPG